MINIRHSPLLLILFAASVCLAQAPSISDYSFTISDAKTWTDTGVDLAAADDLKISAENNAASDALCSPEGHDVFGNPGKLLAPLPAAALIVKTAESANPSIVGKETTTKLSSAGHLFLAVNGGPWNCAFFVKVKLTHTATAPAAAANSSAAQTGTKDKLSSAAQVFFKTQFGKENATSETAANNAVGANGAVATKTSASSSGGLKLPTVILDADLRKKIDGVPRRVHDAHGNLGDMVNFVIVGSQEKAQAALDAADWHVADVDSKEAGLKAIMNTYEK